MELDLNNSNGLKRIKFSHSSLRVIIVGNFGVVTQKIKPNFYYSGLWYDYLSGTTFNISDTNKEFELAAFLFRNTGSLISRTQLLAEIWGTTAEINTRTVDTHIKRIRGKLPKDNVSYGLHTIYGVGYKFEENQ